MSDPPIPRTRCTECSRPARGKVPANGEVPEHTCLQCREHCKITAYIRDELGAALVRIGWWLDAQNGPPTGT
jgi:hypothetical protein